MLAAAGEEDEMGFRERSMIGRRMSSGNTAKRFSFDYSRKVAVH